MCRKRKNRDYDTVEKYDGPQIMDVEDDDEVEPVPSDPKKPRPVQFTIHSLYIGQGDCILIECPEGEFIMIDCGSTEGLRGKSKEEAAEPGKKPKLVTNDTRVAEGLKSIVGATGIKYLIITHSDADHHNRMAILDKAKIKVENVIIGNLEWYDLYYKIQKNTTKASEDDKETNYNTIRAFSAVNYWKNWMIKYTDKRAKALSILNTKCSCQNFFGITLNDGGDYTNGKNLRCLKVTNSGKKVETQPIPENKKTEINNGYFTVLESIKNDWSVKIIAAEVESIANAKSSFMNTASLVTLLEIGEQKVLFTGDSTGATFDYLLESAPQKIKDYFTEPAAGDSKIALLQVPHHGSASFRSNSEAFINKTRPHKIFSSVKFDEGRHNLPRWASLGAWKRNPKNNITKFIKKNNYFGYWISREELASKRIGPFVNNPIIEKDETFDQDEIDDFLNGLKIKQHGSKDDFTMVILKPGAKVGKVADMGRITGLLALNKTVEGDDYFVIQKTKKAIITNGASTVKSYLEKQIEKIKGGATLKSVQIIHKDIIQEAFDNLAATSYVFNKYGIG